MKHLVILKKHYGIFIIFAIAIVLRLYINHLEPFLHTWDEQFHALVALNMTEHPFKPMLVKIPYEAYNYKDWSSNHIWLHKQPLFLWQMALSMKAFGVSIFAMRLPSILLGSLAVFLIYRIGLIWSNNIRLSLIAASLYACSAYHIELITGIRGMDHNDVAFSFYTLASIWAYAEYLKSPKKHWIFLIGLLAGAAILNKWLLGLLVYLGWGINSLLALKNRRLTIENCKDFIAALLTTIIVVLPWQIYVFNAFPLEAAHEFEYNGKHVFHVIEGHAGTWDFYINNAREYFGYFLNYLIIPIACITALRKGLNKELTILFTISLLFVFAFFSFLVQTKIITFVFFVFPLLFLLFAAGLDYIFTLIKWKPIIAFIWIFLLFHNLRVNHLKAYFFGKNEARDYLLAKHTMFKNLSAQLPPNTKVILNANQYDHPAIMFYNPGITAYHYTISEQAMDKLAAEKVVVAAFKTIPQKDLPVYVTFYPYIYIIKEKIYK